MSKDKDEQVPVPKDAQIINDKDLCALDPLDFLHGITQSYPVLLQYCIGYFEILVFIPVVMFHYLPLLSSLSFILCYLIFLQIVLMMLNKMAQRKILVKGNVN